MIIVYFAMLFILLLTCLTLHLTIQFIYRFREERYNIVKTSAIECGYCGLYCAMWVVIFAEGRKVHTSLVSAGAAYLE